MPSTTFNWRCRRAARRAPAPSTAGLLGLEEIAKPAELAGRGRAWFSNGAVTLHLGVEQDFRPARKAHPALRVEGLTAFVARLEAAGYPIQRDVQFAGYDRVHVNDPFGNRIELVERTA